MKHGSIGLPYILLLRARFGTAPEIGQLAPCRIMLLWYVSLPGVREPAIFFATFLKPFHCFKKSITFPTISLCVKEKHKKTNIMSGKGKGKGGRGEKKSTTASAKAGLQFPVGRIGRYLRQGKYATRMVRQ